MSLKAMLASEALKVGANYSQQLFGVVLSFFPFSRRGESRLQEHLDDIQTLKFLPTPFPLPL